MDGTTAVLNYPFPDAPAEGEAIQIADGVLWFRLPLPMRLDHVNIYAFDEGDSWTLIDAGMATRHGRKVLNKILNGPLAGKPVGRVILTHHHPDHVGFVGTLAGQGAEIVATRTAWLMARMLTLDEQETYPEASQIFYRRAGMAQDIFDQRMADRPFNFADIVEPIPLGFTRIQQGDTIMIGGRNWDIHIGHGHAPEHATFWSRDDNLVIAGDQILPSISPNIGVYPTEPEADPLGEWLESCERLSHLGRADQLILGGHKLPFTGVAFRLRQLIDNHHGVLDRLLDHLKTPSTAGETFLPIFKREIGGEEYGLALVEALAHCQHLYFQGKVTRTINAAGAWEYARA